MPFVFAKQGCRLRLLTCVLISITTWVSMVVTAAAAFGEIIVQRGSEIEVNAAVYSPDGRIIASAGESESIRLWDRNSGDLVRVLPGHDGERVMGLAFSPDGKLLASCGNGGTVKLWNYHIGRLVLVLTNHVGNWSRRVAFSPDSRHVAAATYDGKLSVWDTSTGAVTLTLPTRARIADVAFTPSGQWLITASREEKNPAIEFWDIVTGQRGLVVKSTNSIDSVAVSRDGTMLAAGSRRAVALWELPSGKLLWSSEPRECYACDVDFSPDGRRIAVADTWVNQILSTRSGELLAEMRGHEDATIQISFSPDGGEVVSGSADATVRQWDAHSGKLRRILAARPPNSPLTTIAFSPDGRFEAVSGTDGVVRVWAASTGEFLYGLRGHEGPVQTLAFTLDSAWLCSGSADRTMRVWDMAHGFISVVQPLDTFRGDAIGAIGVGGREGLVAFASGPWGNPSLNRDVQLWQTHYERPIRVLRGHTANVRSLSYAPGKDHLVSASTDRTIKLWDSRRADCLATLTNDAFAMVVAHTPDGSAIVAGLADGAIRVLSADSLEAQREWPAHRGTVQGLAFRSDGRWLATAGADRSIVVWEWATGKAVRRFTNIVSQYMPLAFHPKQPVLAFAQRNEMVVHANVETGEFLFQRVQFPDGEWLAWNPAKAVYAASRRGDDHGRVRFAGQLTPVYPLSFYRSELRRTNLLAALAAPAPAITPKDFRLWWHRYAYKEAWLYAGLTLLCVWIGVRLRRGLISERKRRIQENVSRQLLVSQEAERKRIAAELHDSLGQNLLIIKNRLYLAQRDAGGDHAEQLSEISQTVSQTIEEVREISHNLRPYQLDRLGLTKAVKAVVKKVADSGALKIQSELAPIDGLFPPEGEINFYRIVQESLNNVLKHSGASTARIDIARTNGTLTMSIEDDGTGFDYRAVTSDPEHPRGFGLTGLSERVRILGGRFQCDSAPGKGTRLTFEIPVPETTNGHE